MKYLLDTNVIIDLMRNREKSVAENLMAVGVSQCCMSDITLYELYCGAQMAENVEQEVKKIDRMASVITIVSTTDAMKHAAFQKGYLKRRGTLVEDFDLIIGAAAIVNDLILVTANTQHMNRLAGIKLEDWRISIH